MPYFIGRIAAHRLTFSAAATSSSRLVIAKQLGRVSCPLQSSLPLLRAGFVRAYVTPGRPKKTDTASSTQSAGRPRKAPAKKTTAATTTKTKKAATATKSAKPKKKTTPAPKPKEKKELTEAQLAKKELQKVRLEKSELKRKALFTEPKGLPSNPWMLYVTRQSAGSSGGVSMAGRMSAIADEFRSLPHSEKEVIYKTFRAYLSSWAR